MNNLRTPSPVMPLAGPSRTKATTTKAYLALGSNLGDRAANMQSACDQLASHDQITLTGASSLYETPPWGPVAQGPYLNAVVAITTSLAAQDLLDACLAIERAHGRVRSERWGPRTLDIDILIYGDDTIETETLHVPHPRMLERTFVMVPLCDLAPDLILDGKTVSAHVGTLDRSGITRHEGSDNAALAV